jgi:hypothetical protein
MSLLSRFAVLTQAGFVEAPGCSRQWRHTTYGYMTVECHFGTWTMRSPDTEIEIRTDADVATALELLRSKS